MTGVLPNALQSLAELGILAPSGWSRHEFCVHKRQQDLKLVRVWKRTYECSPTSSGGVYVRIGAELGYAKLDSIKREKIGSALGKAVGAPVAVVEYAKVAGFPDSDTFAVSHVSACTDREVCTVDEISSAQNALSRASGLLAFLRWIGAGDHEAGKNLVLRQSANGEPEVVAIDFGNAFEWPEESLSKDHPLAKFINKSVVQDVLTNIEALPCADIDQLCEGGSLAKSLIRERSRLRPFLRSRGWL